MIEADLIIIGAGPGGYELAARRSAAGDRVVVIEARELGGTCLNRGCIPTKCLCRSAEVLSTVRHAADFGISVSGIQPDYARVTERMNAVVSGLRDGVTALLARCTVVTGTARFEADGSVRVGEESYTAPRVVIATGSAPSGLPIPGADLCITSDGLLNLTELPPSIAIIGGGVIGLEFASILNEFGVTVTVIEYCKEILPQFEKDIAKRLRTLLSRRGVSFVTGAAVTSVTDSPDGLVVNYTAKKGDASVTASTVLMATGRRPVVPEGLAEAGIEVSPRGFIVTDENMMTSRPDVYAVGDCNGRLMLAHAATAQAERIYNPDINLDVIPSAVFTLPEVAMVGRTSEQLDSEGVTYKTAKALFAANGKAQALGEPDGLVKVLIDPGTQLILGAHIIGAHASDLIHEIALAMTARVPAPQIGLNTVHCHPTLSELVAVSLRS